MAKVHRCLVDDGEKGNVPWVWKELSRLTCTPRYQGWERRRRSMRQVVLILTAMTCVAGISACSSGEDRSLISADQEVLLVPQVNAGWTGWCVISVNGSVGGCPPGKSHLPIIAESWSSGGPPRETESYAVTTSQVAAVSFDDEPPVPTHAEAELPNGLRAVVLEIHGRSLLEERGSVPRFTPLNAKGETIRPSRSVSSRLLGIEVPTRSLGNPAHPTSGPCRMTTEHLRDLSVGGGSVISQVRSYSGLIGKGFLSCASTSYNLDGWPLLAGMLLNAGHPGSAPRSLLGMKPLKGHPGIFQAPGPEGLEPDGGMIARRVHGAWLVITRAKLPQRLALLAHLRATIHI
jgi:hypothetical protein